MSSLEWVPELAAALERAVPLEESSRADWEDVVARVGSRHKLVPWRPRRGVRFAVVVALIFLLLTGAATATYFLLRGNGSIALGGGSSLPVLNPNGPGLHTVASCPAQHFPYPRLGCSISEPAWSPDGTRVAFLRGRYGGPKDRSKLSLYVTRAGGGVKRLAACGGCGAPAWSPDGRWIAFSRDDGLHPPTVLWIVAATGGRPRQLTHCSGTCADTEPVWAPTGSLIAFQRVTRMPGPSRLYSIRPDGTHLMRIANGGEVAWSPDGRRIAFDGPDGIEVANPDGSDARVLATGRGSPGAPSWSPTGQKLVFFETPGHPPGRFTFEVWTVNADGSDKQRLYHSGCCVQGWARPIWSPDGRMIAFSANSANGTYVMNADGSGLRRLSRETYLSLSWQGLPRH